MAVPHLEESAVDDFAVQLFWILSYTGRAVGRIAMTRKYLPFWVCGEQRLHAKADVCIMDASDILLLVQEDDKRHLDGSDPEPGLIAEAIAIFYNNNNNMRVRAPGSPTLQSKVVPGMMKGTMLIFYKIPTTTGAVRAVRPGEFPAHETVVCARLPTVRDLLAAVTYETFG